MRGHIIQSQEGGISLFQKPSGDLRSPKGPKVKLLVHHPSFSNTHISMNLSLRSYELYDSITIESEITKLSTIKGKHRNRGYVCYLESTSGALMMYGDWEPYDSHKYMIQVKMIKERNRKLQCTSFTTEKNNF